jgi:hypothetical protein
MSEINKLLPVHDKNSPRKSTAKLYKTLDRTSVLPSKCLSVCDIWTSLFSCSQIITRSHMFISSSSVVGANAEVLDIAVCVWHR